jgi:hypothetical protein
MSHSLLNADRRTLFKILAVALIGACIVVGVGIRARITDTSSTAARISTPVLKAGKPTTYTSHDASSVR